MEKGEGRREKGEGRRIAPIVGFVFLGAVSGLISSAGAQSLDNGRFEMGDDGSIPAWLAAGPFELGIEGFGVARDDDPIGEVDASPVEDLTESTPLVAGGQVSWQPFSAGNNGYMDFMEAVGWSLPSDEPEKIWWAKAAYAFAIVESDRDREAVLRTGSNSALKVILNGEVVFRQDADRTAAADDDSIAVRLSEGSNRLLIRVGQTFRNEGPSFFGYIPWQWGFFARFDDPDGLSVTIPVIDSTAGPSIRSTFYFRETDDGIVQRFDVTVENKGEVGEAGRIVIQQEETTHSRQLGAVPFGVSRHEVWLPAVDKATSARLLVEIGDDSSASEITLEPQPRYEIYLAMMSHTDIGYTNIQPVVKERYLKWIDQVIERCDEDSTFKWTLETVWQLEQYRLGRPESEFNRLIEYIKAGRIAVSPIYTNPFTGWIGNEEMVRSFDHARWYREEYGLEFEAAVYNDVPGLSWVVPQILNDNGVGFLATGINEVYGGYPLQRNLPKAWIWEGPGGGRIVTYRNEAYNEAQPYGLEKDTTAAKYKIWERLNRLRAQGHDREIVLAIHTLGDNGPIPLSAGPVAGQWNEGYAWPRFRISTIDEFASRFVEEYGDSLPTLRGDWTSTWDVQYQGEPERMIKQRWTQQNLPTAEKMATIAWMNDPSELPLTTIAESAYDNLLHFSGHGSGLEYGYGSPRDNLVTMAYREQYVETALLQTTEVLERALFKLSTPEESFEGEALFLFNPLNWSRDAVVEFEFPRENQHGYRAVDIETGEEIAYDFSGYTLRFVARDIPPLGYKKIRLHRTAGDGSSAVQTDLTVDGCSIENSFYRIEADCQHGVTAVIDKRSDRQLAGSRFGDPVRAQSLGSPVFETLTAPGMRITVIDQRPVRLTLEVERDDHLFVKSSFELWENRDEIVVGQILDLTALGETDDIQEYSARFEFDIQDASALIDVAGGLLDPATDRLPGVEHDLFATRSGLALVGDGYTVDWVGVDNRVIRLRETDDGHPVIYANLVNNFPEAWNRWEAKEATLGYTFLIRGRPDVESRQESTWDFIRFASESTSPTVGRYTWLRSTPASGSFMSIEGNVVLSGFRRHGDKIEVRLVNPDTRSPTETVIQTGNAISLEPGEITTIFIDPHRSTTTVE